MELPSKLLIDGWELISPLGNGGQSLTFLIQRNGVKGLLKIPASLKLSKEQSFRFKQEAEALKVLDGRGTPKVIGYSGEEPHYILMEYIDGKTLSQLVSGKPLNTDHSLQIINNLSEIVELVHEIGLQHRDIKPDNIIIDSDLNVTLIDFGLCYFMEEKLVYQTPPDKEIGNRFLRLPEYAKGRSISTIVSDVTFVTGILYYMLTGKQPNLLLNENGHMPHQSDIPRMEKWMIYTFDRGFAYIPSQRFQSANELVNFINDQKSKFEIMPNSEHLTNLTDYLKSPHLKKLSDIKAMILEAHEVYWKSANKEVKDGIHLYAETGVHESSGYGLTVRCAVRIDNDNSISAPFELTTFINNELTTISHEYMEDDGTIVKASYEVSEKTRLFREYEELAILRVQLAVKKLLEDFKQLHENKKS